MASRLSAGSKQPCHASFSTAGIRARGACCPPLPAPWAACTHQDTRAFLRACPGECNASLHLCIHFSICLCLFLQTHKPEKACSQQKLPVHTNLHAGQWCSPVLGVEALMFPFTALQKINCFHAAMCPGGQGLHRAHNDTVCSQHPERSAQMKACTAQHPAALQHQAWLAGRAGTACSAQEPCPSTSQLPASASRPGLSTVPGLHQGKGTSLHTPPGQGTKPSLGLSASSECAWQKAAPVLWPPQSWQPGLADEQLAGKGAGCALSSCSSACQPLQALGHGCTQLCQSAPTSG